MSDYHTWASVVVPTTYVLSRIKELALGTDAVYDVDRLYVDGVSQAALDSALTSYNHVVEVSNTKWAIVRKERDKRLAACDWTQMPDSPLYNNAAWLSYRQALRDVPTNNADPDNVNWPTSP